LNETEKNKKKRVFFRQKRTKIFCFLWRHEYCGDLETSAIRNKNNFFPSSGMKTGSNVVSKKNLVVTLENLPIRSTSFPNDAKKRKMLKHVFL
jgi:hypothetical protein